MIDVFTEEIEVLIKNGISNLYWFRDDLKKSWIRAGVDPNLSQKLYEAKNDMGGKLTKREMMDLLYENLRHLHYHKRLEISRNFVRTLTEHKNFVPLDSKHRIKEAEICAYRLKDIIKEQQDKKKAQEENQRAYKEQAKNNYSTQLEKLYDRFRNAFALQPQQRGYELEKIFSELMRISKIDITDSFRNDAEQIDGAIKYDGYYYLVELKWRKNQTDLADIASHYMKVEGKMDARGIFISMEGYTQPTLSALPKGKTIKVLLMDGVHLMNVITGQYTFGELLEASIKQASLKGEVLAPYSF
jgi:hypothetical protein